MRAALSIVILSSLTAGPALAAGDPATGHRLAEQWCASCHAVDREATRSDAAPTFARLARERSPQSLRGWLSDPHPPMPNTSLTRREIDDVLAYIESLARQ